MRRDVEFLSDGLKCKGWFYVPDDIKEGQKVPVIVMAHGFSAVKEMFLSNYADRFIASGMAVLVFDYRFLGESEGEPRGQVLPHTQLDDYRNARTTLVFGVLPTVAGMFFTWRHLTVESRPP